MRPGLARVMPLAADGVHREKIGVPVGERCNLPLCQLQGGGVADVAIGGHGGSIAI
jgi:hypothetical protein